MVLWGVNILCTSCNMKNMHVCKYMCYVHVYIYIMPASFSQSIAIMLKMVIIDVTTSQSAITHCCTYLYWVIWIPLLYCMDQRMTCTSFNLDKAILCAHERMTLVADLFDCFIRIYWNLQYFKQLVGTALLETIGCICLCPMHYS